MPEPMSEHGGCHDLFSQAPAAVIWLRGPSHIVEFANERSMCLLGNRDPVGKPLRHAAPELAGQPFLGLLDSVYATGEPFGARAMPAILGGHRRVPEQCFFDFTFQPTRDARGKVDGILIQAVAITEQVMGRQRVEQLAEHLRLARDQATRLLRLTAALSSTGTLSQVVDLSLCEGLAALGAAAASISLLDAQGTHLELAGQLGYPMAL
ncbi:MAG: histidine kinase, partial [bacterium]|nr:histidine kinase [bacterium]